MKVSLNLAVSPGGFQRYAAAWGLPAALLGLAAAIILGISAASSAGDFFQASRDRIRLQGEAVDLIQKERVLRQQLEQPHVQAVFRNVRFINDAIARRKVSVTGMTQEVTALLPKGVRLTSLALAPDEKSLNVRFVLSAESEEALEDFLIKLEDSRNFKDVAITNQTFEESGIGGVPVRLTCTARYVQ